MGFEFTAEQLNWAAKRRQGVGTLRLRELVEKQQGKCALSGAPLIFDKQHGTPAPGRSCHPLYAAVDHIAPQSGEAGFQLVCYDLNDLKGHLPQALFRVLARSTEWRDLMSSWRALAESDPHNVLGFRALIWAAESMPPIAELERL